MEVRIKTDKLLAILKENLAKHREIVEEAFTQYRALAITELDAMIREAKAGKRIRRGITLVEPVDQTKEYQKAIRQLELSTEEVITLSEHEFDCLVMDNWNWKVSFSAANSRYTVKAKEQE